MSESTACLNCQHAFGAPRPRFCPACGQESNLKPPTLFEFVQQFGGAYFSTEGALWRTLKLMVLQPGELTRQYLAGRRKHYVLPLRLYLTISVIVLLLIRLLPQGLGDLDLQVKAGRSTAANPTTEGRRPQMDIDLGFARAGVRGGEFYCENLPASLCARLKRRVDIEPKAIQAEVAAYGERFVANLGGALFVLVPAFAAWLALAWRNRHLRYTEHLVFALHLHAFGFLALALTLTPWDGLNTVVTFAATAHVLVAMKHVYGGRWAPLLARAAFVSLAYLATLAATLACLAVWSMLF